jgi:hypothetical protein
MVDLLLVVNHKGREVSHEGRDVIQAPPTR